MKTFDKFWFAFALVWGFIMGSFTLILTTPSTTIRTHHRLTPRMELVIDSGRVDTIFIYKAEGK